MYVLSGRTPLVLSRRVVRRCTSACSLCVGFHPWPSMDGHYSVWCSVTASMEVAVAVTIPDHPWMDTTCVPSLPLSQYTWMLSQLPWPFLTIHGWIPQCTSLCHSIHGCHSCHDHSWPSMDGHHLCHSIHGCDSCHDHSWLSMDGHHCAHPSVKISIDVMHSCHDHPCPSMDGYYCIYSSVMDVTVAVTIPDHPWMDTSDVPRKILKSGAHGNDT